MLRRTVLFLAILAASTGAVAQPSPDAVSALSADLAAAQRAHLWRVGVWGAANVAAGTALLLVSDREAGPGPRAFGVQSAAWGAINVGIAAWGLASGPDAPTADWASALGAENGYADVLLVNLGLNVGYAAVGTTLWAVASRGVSTPDAWRGHGRALVVQGLGLLVLDGVAYLGTRARLGSLVDLAASAALSPGGVAFVLPF